MKKILRDQSGIVFIPIIAGALVLGTAGTVAYSRVKHNQLEKQKNSSSLKLQESITDSTKKLAAKKEEKKPEPVQTEQKPAEPIPALVQKTPTTTTITKTTTTTTKPKTETTYTKPTSTPPTGTLSLQHVSGNNVAWALNGSAPYGLKLVWSTSSGPVYPGSSAKYFNGTSTTSATIDAGSGNYYVRVCMYHDGSCINYSNEININIP